MPFFVIAMVLAVVANGTWLASGAIRRCRGSRGRGSVLVFFLLSVVVGVAAWLRYGFVPAHHAMYLDEPWYAEAACNLARTGSLALCEETWAGPSCAPYEKAPGWPVMVSLWVRVGGCAGAHAIEINRLLGTASVPLIALAAVAAGASLWQGTVAAAILAIHPTHVAWSATGETNVAAAWALLVGVCGGLLYLRDRPWGDALLAATALGLATAIRPESLLPALAVAAVVSLARGGAKRERRMVALSIIAISFVAALAALPLWSMNEEISGGGFLSMTNVLSRFADGPGFAGLRIHGPVGILGLMGLLMVARRRGAAAALILGAALPVALVVMAYDRFAERMLLGATVALLPASALALAWICPPRRPGRRRRWLRWVGEAAIPALLLCLWWSPLLTLAVPAESQVLETRIAATVARQAMPPNSLIVLEQPTILAAGGLSGVMSSEEALRDESRLARAIAAGRPVFHLWDMYCEGDFSGGRAPGRCRRLHERFASSEIAHERLNMRRYALYRLSVE